MTAQETPDEALDYLDELRESGETNMFGAGAYLEAEFDVDGKTARTWLTHWMQIFSARAAGKSGAAS